MFIINRVVLVLNAFAILMLLAAYLAPLISPVLFWPIAFFGLAYPVLLALNVLFVIYWIIVFRFKFIFSLLAILAGYNYIPYIAQINAKKTVNYDNSIRMMSFNMKYFGAFEGRKIEDPDKFFDALDKVDPDVCSFQEFANHNTPVEGPLYKRLFKRLKKFYTYNIIMHADGFRTGIGVVIFSRFPIINSGEVEHEPGLGNFTVFVDIVAYGDTIRVVNTHLRSIHFEGEDYRAFKNLELHADSNVVQFSNISRKLKKAFLSRARQAELVREFIDQSSFPVILSGDFNDPPTSYAFRTIRGEMKDAFVEAGSGLGRTYVGQMPSFRIDYILHDRKFRAFNYYAKAFEFSDHKMISATIRIKD